MSPTWPRPPASADFDARRRGAGAGLLAGAADAGAAAARRRGHCARGHGRAATVALRVPAHPLAQALLAGLRLPLGRRRRPTPRAGSARRPAAHVIEGLGGRIDAVLDGGPCPVGVEFDHSWAFSGPATLLRPGGLPVEAVEACLGVPSAAAGRDPASRVAPGQLASHYAPRARLRLNADGGAPGRGAAGLRACAGAGLNLSPAGDLVEAAANLFAMLRAARRRAAGRPSPCRRCRTRGLGRAINDRLRRAAAPRDARARRGPDARQAHAPRPPVACSAAAHLLAVVAREDELRSSRRRSASRCCRISDSSCPGPQPE